jgi:hypothetical protein
VNTEDKNNASSNAFPVDLETTLKLEEGYWYDTLGLTKREHFAGLIMQAEKIHHGASGNYGFNPKEAARSAVECADALIIELGKGGAE